MRELKIGGKYRHYKEKDYVVLGVAKHSETLEKLVVYQAQYDDKPIWVRPYEMFLGEVEIDGKMVTRFREID